MATRKFIPIWLFFLCFAESAYGQSRTGDAVHQYIISHWDSTVEYHPNDSADYIGLPRPYTAPTVKGERLFKELFYWDTYFTNLGLIRDGRVDLAKNNTDDILYLVKRFGKMPNGSNTHFLNRSQPPFLSMMVRDVYEKTKDNQWLAEALIELEKEYKFWMTERMTGCGLNHYGHSANNKEKLDMLRVASFRFKNPKFLSGLSDSAKLLTGSHLIAECESGWDFTPRFGAKCMDYCPVDLNSNLYLYEINFSWFYKKLGLHKQSKFWSEKAATRKTLLYQYCFDSKTGLFLDYNFVNQTKSTMVTAASFYPFYAGLVNKKDKKKALQVLKLLETKHGIRAVAEGVYDNPYQWGPDNLWAPLQCIAYLALKENGMKKEAIILRMKYMTTVENNFLSTGKLWEKYNVVTGNINTVNEYEMTTFMGWTAGVYTYFYSE